MTDGTRQGRMPAPAPAWFEAVPCYACGSTQVHPLVTAEDDLTGKPGEFRFVTCDGCGLAFQNPRLRLEHIGAYYDDEYIAHRKKKDWGVLTGFFNWAMDRHDRQKAPPRDRSEGDRRRPDHRAT